MVKSVVENVNVPLTVITLGVNVPELIKKESSLAPFISIEVNTLSVDILNVTIPSIVASSVN